MTSAVEILTPILNKTLTTVEDWEALADYAQQQIKPTPTAMTEHKMLVEKYTHIFLMGNTMRNAKAKKYRLENKKKPLGKVA